MDNLVRCVDETERRAFQTEAAQQLDDFAAVLAPYVQVFGDHLVDDEVQLLGNFRRDLAGRDELALLLVHNDFESRVPRERQLARQEVVQRDPQRVDVGASIDVLRVASLLGSHVVRCAEARAALRHRQVFVGRFGETEVGHFDLALGRHHHVVGLDVAMNHALVVSDLQSLRTAQRDVQCIADVELAEFVHPTLHRLTIDEFHRHVMQAVVLIHVVHTHGVVVIHLRHRTGFAVEAFDKVALPRQSLRQDFDRRLATELGVFTQVHFAHASLAELPHDLVLADLRDARIGRSRRSRVARLFRPFGGRFS